jgi:VWFA-related protein
VSTGGQRRAALALALASIAAPAHAAAAAAPANTAPAAASKKVGRIAVTSPDGSAPVFGAVEFAVELDSPEPLAELLLFVDGSLVARLVKPPFRVRYDVGEFNTEHQFVAEARTIFGTRLKAARSTPTLEIGEQVDVELVQLYVRVTGAGAARQLGADDFRVTDELGTRMPVTTLQRGDVPISTVVLVDSSDSMQGEAFRQAVAGAQTTAALLGKEDEVMIALFSDRLLRATEFTRDRASLKSALEGVEASGGSAVFDYLYFGLNRLKTRLGRPVVVLFSDGEDVTSTLDADDVRWRSRRSQATVYWVRVEDPANAERRFATFWRDEPECTRHQETLEAAVVESGGGIVTIRSVGELSAALIRIFEDLRSQYVVGFHPQKRRHDGSWRPVHVQTADKSALASARAGYVDD